MARTKTTNIAPDLQPLAVPISDLTSDPDNSRKGDVEAIARSYARFGQRKPIVVRQTSKRGRRKGIVVAGNHQLAAAQSLGWEEVAVVWVVEDAATATAYALADNRTSDLAVNDDAALLSLLQGLSDEMRDAASYTQDDVDALLVLTAPPDLDDLVDGLGEPHARDGLRRVVLWLPPDIASELTEAIGLQDDEHGTHLAIAQAWLNG